MPPITIDAQPLLLLIHYYEMHAAEMAKAQDWALYDLCKDFVSELTTILESAGHTTTLAFDWTNNIP